MLRSAVLLVFVFPAFTGPARGGDIEDAARQVYNQIARVSGVSGQPPRLIVISESQRQADRFKRQIAWYDHAANTIGIDRKTLGLWARMKDSGACIAVFLAHELAHFYKDHRWGGDFGSRFPDSDIGVQVKALSAANILSYEAQADDVGGLYSYLAGYDTLSLAPAVLDNVYAEYKLPPNLPGYPSLAARKEIAKKGAARLQILTPVFEAGTLLLALGRYEDAGRCFDRIAQTFPGGAELNNAGLSYVLEATGLFAREANAGGYPWTIDAQSRLEPRTAPQSRGAVSETREEKIKRLTNAAEERFSEAIRRDPAYLPAILNLAFLEHLTGRRGTAEDRIAGISTVGNESHVAHQTAGYRGHCDKNGADNSERGWASIGEWNHQPPGSRPNTHY
jgi:tetratricopeptide (TPR) repeat protein